MLWIDGHNLNGGFRSLLFPGKSRDISEANKVFASSMMNQWNCQAIDSGCTAVFNADRCFQMGYHYAAENSTQLFNHIMLCGNRLIVAAFGNGVAFAEGMAAFLYEEKRLRVHLALYIYGAAMNEIPQLEEAVYNRVVISKSAPFSLVRQHKGLTYKNIFIEEKKLASGFSKFTFSAFINNEKLPLGFYIRRRKIKDSFFTKKAPSPAVFWPAVFHCVSILEIADNFFAAWSSSQIEAGNLFELNYN